MADDSTSRAASAYRDADRSWRLIPEAPTIRGFVGPVEALGVMRLREMHAILFRIEERVQAAMPKTGACGQRN